MLIGKRDRLIRTQRETMAVMGKKEGQAVTAEAPAEGIVIRERGWISRLRPEELVEDCLIQVNSKARMGAASRRVQRQLTKSTS
jgi:hypothetical protein